ncbi:MAG: hypothetical protein HDR82_09910 [Bacteroides sp.]|nr:hypothetical protein [Bacteroides sp.]
MDADKLNEAAVEYRNSSNVSTENFCLTDIEDAFEACAQWLMQQPLSDRLTDEEKERIKAKYNELKSLNSITNDMFADDTAILEWLFGKELFTNQPTEV